MFVVRCVFSVPLDIYKWSSWFAAIMYAWPLVYGVAFAMMPALTVQISVVAAKLLIRAGIGVVAKTCEAVVHRVAPYKPPMSAPAVGTSAAQDDCL
jgi:hypothetical protein